MALTLEDLGDHILVLIYQWLIAIACGMNVRTYRMLTRTALSCANQRFRNLSLPLLFNEVSFSRVDTVKEFISIFSGGTCALLPQCRYVFTMYNFSN